MLHRPSKAVMAKIVEAFGALLAALAQPFVSHDVGYAQVVPGQKSRKVRNHMLKSPFKSVIARAATFALVLSLGIAFVSVGLTPGAYAQMAEDDPCTTNDDGRRHRCPVEFDYDENGTELRCRLQRNRPRGRNGHHLGRRGASTTALFDITGGVLTFKDSPNYEDADRTRPRAGRYRSPRGRPTCHW